jgi:hypothetical protein
MACQPDRVLQRLRARGPLSDGRLVENRQAERRGQFDVGCRLAAAGIARRYLAILGTSGLAAAALAPSMLALALVASVDYLGDLMRVAEE